MEAPLIIFLVLLLLVGPILGIIAFVGMRRLHEVLRRQNFQELTGRIYALEQQLARLEKAQADTPPVAVLAAPPLEAKPSGPPLSPPVPSVPIPGASPALPSTPPLPTAKPREVAPSFSGSGFAPPPLHTSQGKASDTNDLETVIG